MEKFGDWLNQNDHYQSINHTKVTIILTELQNHRIGISAFGLFTITYGQIGSVRICIYIYMLIFELFLELLNILCMHFSF